jgi:hypothetical protein
MEAWIIGVGIRARKQVTDLSKPATGFSNGPGAAASATVPGLGQRNLGSARWRVGVLDEFDGLLREPRTGGGVGDSAPGWVVSGPGAAVALTI